MISANVNYYAINPFDNPLAVRDPESKAFWSAGNKPREKPLIDEGTRQLKATSEEIELPDFNDFSIPSSLDEIKIGDYEIPSEVGGVDLSGFDYGELNFEALKDLTPEDFAELD